MSPNENKLLTIQQNWDTIIQTIIQDMELTPTSYNLWLLPLKPAAFENGTLTVLYPGEEFARHIIEKKYSFILQSAVEALIDGKCRIQIVTALEEPAAPRRQVQSNLNPRYTFDTFVVGSGNRMAHAAALAVAESPASVYNPLFIYGGSGLGKTHLMQSIVHFILEKNPEMKVIYVSSEQFLTDLVDSIRNKENDDAFRSKYRSVDVLLIDDIQFITSKDRTQEELFHTFNALYDAKKQIIISSDRPPRELDSLPERLRSRFEWGLTVDITYPDYETRMAILRSKEESENYSIDNEVIKYIATNIRSNIRELEGALTKIVAYSHLINKEITLALAEEALKDHIYPNREDVITPERIIAVVAEHFELKTEDLSSERRNKEVAYPRQIAMYLCCNLTNASLSNIGKALGKKDHTTVIHGRDKIAKEIEENPSLKNTIEVLKKKLSPG
ncbi:MAG: chromosomal replication initiator protein DnaA [Lachnospiraceae bacterium]|nr:chromosomal replication initiator protein DnaA [Lachnospiraceae bacterium]